MNPISRTLLTALLMLCMVSFAHAKRVALVMGNDNYTAVSKLQKAGNDADAMARELRLAGFTVQLQKNLNYRSMVKVVESFANGITGGDEVVVFFAGHGVQIRSGSYLLPIDIEADSESQVEKTAYGINDLTEKLSEAKAAFALVVIDACRDNPLKTKGRSIGATRGLSAVEPAKGQMIVYSASRGQQALDRLSDRDPSPNGVFTREFIARMKKPGVRIEDMVREVQDAVETLAKTVSHEQRPALYNEARGNFYFYGPTTVQVAPIQVPAIDPTTNDRALWETVRDSKNPDEIRAYLDQFPKGLFAGVAKARLSATTQVASAPVVVSPVIRREPAASVAVNVFKDCAECPEMVVIPSGSFEMGDTGSDEKPVHRVTLRSFSMGKTEVTQGQWRAIMGRNPSRFSGCGNNCPVENVSWEDAKQFVSRLTTKTGKTYRLPSEAEWEYACRAGGRHEYCGSADEVAWYSGNSGNATHPVAGKQANAWGLHDMNGNVWEWTEDCWNRNYNAAPTDGGAWATGDCSQRVVRGGSWLSGPQFLRSAHRARFASTLRFIDFGFRVARTD